MTPRTPDMRPPAPSPEPPERLAYSVPEAAALMSLSERTVRALVASGTLPCCRVGRRVLITRAAIEEFLQ